jgi:hypothetical protein
MVGKTLVTELGPLWRKPKSASDTTEAGVPRHTSVERFSVSGTRGIQQQPEVNTRQKASFRRDMRTLLRASIFLFLPVIAMSQNPRHYPWGEWQEFGSGPQTEVECRGRCADWGPSGAGGFNGTSWDVQCHNVTSRTIYEFNVGIGGQNFNRLDLSPGQFDIAGAVGGGRSVACDQEPNITISHVNTRAAK